MYSCRWRTHTGAPPHHRPLLAFPLFNFTSSSFSRPAPASWSSGPGAVSSSVDDFFPWSMTASHGDSVEVFWCVCVWEGESLHCIWSARCVCVCSCNLSCSMGGSNSLGQWEKDSRWQTTKQKSSWRKQSFSLCCVDTFPWRRDSRRVAFRGRKGRGSKGLVWVERFNIEIWPSSCSSHNRSLPPSFSPPSPHPPAPPSLLPPPFSPLRQEQNKMPTCCVNVSLYCVKSFCRSIKCNNTRWWAAGVVTATRPNTQTPQPDVSSSACLQIIISATEASDIYMMFYNTFYIIYDVL